MEMDDVAAMEVLKDIKALMDSRLGDKLSTTPEEPAMGEEIPEVAPEMDMESGELEELKRARQSMMLE